MVLLSGHFFRRSLIAFLTCLLQTKLAVCLNVTQTSSSSLPKPPSPAIFSASFLTSSASSNSSASVFSALSFSNSTASSLPSTISGTELQSTLVETATGATTAGLTISGVTTAGVIIAGTTTADAETATVSTPARTIPSTASLSGATAATPGVTTETKTTNKPAVTSSPPVPPATVYPLKDIGKCSCDWHQGACDVNCCCDVDCSKALNDSFDGHCKLTTSQQTLPLPVCVSKEVIYKTNNLHYDTKTSDGLFCIYRNNYEEQKFFPTRDPLPSKSEIRSSTPSPSPSFERVLSSKSSLVDLTGVDSASGLSLEEAQKKAAFKDGDPLVVLRADDACATFNLPHPGFTPSCLDSVPVLFLRDAKHSCERQLANVTENCASLPFLNSSFYTDLRFLPGGIIRKQENSTEYEVFACPPDADVKELVVDVSGQSCRPEYDDATQSCKNAVQDVKVEVKVNETDGAIASVSMKFECGDVEGSASAVHKIKHFVVFTIVNKDGGEIASFPRSGNPGYLSGKPILAGILNKTDTTAADEGEATEDEGSQNSDTIRISSDSSTWLSLPSPGIGGGCLSRHHLVLFNQNFIQTCNLDLAPLANCSALQKEAFRIFLGPEAIPDRLGMFGNSDPQKPGDWIPIYDEKKPKPDSAASGETKCRNMLKGVGIKILYANAGATINPQPKIIGVLRTFVTEEGIVDVSKDRAMTLRASVTFYDVTQNPENYYNPAPVITAQVPSDFFYPLFRNNRASFIKGNFCLSLLLGMWTVVFLFLS